jgi:class 3 adenylate cyclase/predicted ATPase
MVANSSTAAAAPRFAEPTASAERRQLTVMFCDLVGSTALSARLDPEDMREIIAMYYSCCSEHITKAGGFVARYLGDGVLAYFGYPEAHEYDAERAVRGALSLTQAVPKLPTGHDVALRVRVGVATGVVVVGDLIGEGAAQEQGVIGETPNLAARLQALAEPGQVVISNSTRRLTGGMFEYGDLGRVTLKGLPEPVQVWEVLGPSSVQSRFKAQHQSGLTPLVGREKELELLMLRWQQAKRGEGQVVLLSGEPGIGKSRLAVALEERLRGEPCIRLREYCSPHHSDSAFHPVLRQLERAARFERGDAPGTKLDKLASLLGSPSVDDVNIRLLAELLSIPTGDRCAPLNWSPQRKKEKTIDALLRQLEILSRHWAVLLVYEDAHWSDPSSRELLSKCVERVPRLPLLLLMTCRPEFQPPWLGRANVTRVTLNRLDRREGEALINTFQGSHQLQHEIVGDILERADGIPLFVEELAKAVLEVGSDNGGAATSPNIQPAAVGLPASLHASLMARLDRLGPTAKKIAQIGATIGREFPYDLLRAVAKGSEAEIRAALGRLHDAGLVYREGVPPQATFAFKHALVRDAAYGSLLRGERRELHKRVAEAIEKVEPEMASTQPEVLAYHTQEAGLTERAVEWWGKAGKRALEHSAYPEAIAHLEKSLRLAEKLRKSPAQTLQRLQLQTSYGFALAHGRGQTSAESVAAFSRARELAADVEDPTKRASAFYGLWAGSLTRGDLASMREVSEAFLRDASRWPASPGAGIAHRMFGTTCWFAGDYGGARAHIERAIATYDYDRDRHLAPDLGYDIGVNAMANLGLVLWPLGKVDQAARVVEEAVALAVRGGHPPTVALANSYACLLGALRRNPLPVATHAAAVFDVAREHGLPVWLASAKFYGGWARWWNGDREGQAEMREGQGLFHEMDMHLLDPLRETLLAEVDAASGEVAQGLASMDVQLGAIERTGERWFQAEALRVRGELLRTQASVDAAEVGATFNRAMEIAAGQHAMTFQLRAATSLSRLWRDQGKRREARDLLAPVYASFTEGFDTADLKEAKALLEDFA